MKNILLVIAIGLTMLTGCTGVKNISTTLENQSFLEFVGNPRTYVGGVDVTIDEQTTFKAEVNKDHADRPKGKVYALSTGTHVVVVAYGNQVIYKKQIFISAQETRKILLP
jgi:hypothetical protein